MPYRNGFAIGLGVALAGALLGQPLRAEAPVSYALEYTAGENCPDEQAFVQAIQARAPLATRSDKTSANIVFEAHISTEGGVSRGFLLVRPAGGGVTRRDVPDAPCVEIVASMAVIAALVVEGLSEASSAQPAAETPAPKASPTTPPAPAVTTPQPARAPPGVASAPQRPKPRPTSSRPQEPPRSDTGASVRVGLAVATGIESATAPDLTPALAVAFDLSSRSRAVFSPSLRLSGLYAQSGQTQTDVGTARFLWLAARLALCPVLFESDPFALRPCAELDAGALQGDGEAPINPQTQSLLWLGAGAALHGEIALGPVLALDGQLGGRVLAKPGEFVFLPNTPVHDTGRFSFGALLGLVARLP